MAINWDTRFKVLEDGYKIKYLNNVNSLRDYGGLPSIINETANELITIKAKVLVTNDVRSDWRGFYYNVIDQGTLSFNISLDLGGGLESVEAVILGKLSVNVKGLDYYINLTFAINYSTTKSGVDNAVFPSALPFLQGGYGFDQGFTNVNAKAAGGLLGQGRDLKYENVPLKLKLNLNTANMTTLKSWFFTTINAGTYAFFAQVDTWGGLQTYTLVLNKFDITRVAANQYKVSLSATGERVDYNYDVALYDAEYALLDGTEQLVEDYARIIDRGIER